MFGGLGSSNSVAVAGCRIVFGGLGSSNSVAVAGCRAVAVVAELTLGLFRTILS